MTLFANDADRHAWDDEPMRRLGSAILIVGLGLLGGCNNSTGASNDSGILTGGIYLCGGFSDHGCPGVVVAGISAKPIPGTVVPRATLWLSRPSQMDSTFTFDFNPAPTESVRDRRPTVLVP